MIPEVDLKTVALALPCIKGNDPDSGFFKSVKVFFTEAAADLIIDDQTGDSLFRFFDKSILKLYPQLILPQYVLLNKDIALC